MATATGGSGSFLQIATRTTALVGGKTSLTRRGGARRGPGCAKEAAVTWAGSCTHNLAPSWRSQLLPLHREDDQEDAVYQREGAWRSPNSSALTIWSIADP